MKSLILQANDLEETIKRIQGHKGVVGMMIVNNDGKYVSFRLQHLSIAKFFKLEKVEKFCKIESDKNKIGNSLKLFFAI